ncbi:MAG: hypothetical protein ACR2GL_08470 [Thermoleophilaceae bacterium]
MSQLDFAHEDHEGKEPDREETLTPDPAEDGIETGPEGETGAGGYEGRDPKEDLPRSPSLPTTQDDPHSHDGAPPEDGKERGPHE